MAVVYLIRHGQASFGKEDYDLLSPLGEQQAKVLGNSLQARVSESPLVVSGTMKRHGQTRDLAGFGSGTGWLLQQDSDWNEYDHQEILGKLDPRLTTAAGTREALKQEKDPKVAFARFFSDATARWQSGDYDDYSESWQSFRSRVKRGLESVLTQLRQKEQKNAFVFTSGGPISVVTQHLLGLAEKQLLPINWTLANCGVTKVVSTQNRLFLSTLNDHSHFDFPDTQELITYK